MNEPREAVEPLIHVSDLGPEQAVGRLLDYAADLKVSDLFFTPNETFTTVAARHLGILRLVTALPADLGKRCTSHIKAMAGLDLAERRRPLDGRWVREVEGRAIDLRINTIPTLYGEDVTLRLLERETKLLDLEQLGMQRRELNTLLDLLNSPSGLILVTGPTGSGKTTTLYACLNYLNNGRRKINTIEDPVEYSVSGIRQSQVNLKIDLDFPELLRSVLRQSPDIIMVGEVRDPLTAETAVRAANSGHLVLATLHAPIAAGAIQSMLSLGVHPHFLSSSLRGVVAQRLVRTLCRECRLTFDLSLAPNTFDEVRPWLAPDEGQVLYAAKGCGACLMTGYGARTGVFEILPVTREIRKLVGDRQSTQAIRQKAVEEGLLEFKTAALLKVARGETTVEEIVRVVPTEYLGLED